MRGVKIVLALIMLCIMALYGAEAAFARSASLTTTITITVKAPPKSNVLESDKNAEMLNQLAMNQSMIHPHISEVGRMVENIKFSGEKVYTITDKL